MGIEVLGVCQEVEQDVYVCHRAMHVRIRNAPTIHDHEAAEFPRDLADVLGRRATVAAPESKRDGAAEYVGV